MAQDKPQQEQKHPDEWERDLNPDRLAGQNIGAESVDAEPEAHYAADVAELVGRLREFTMDELREIPVLRPGARLRQGARYLDLSDPTPAPFTATGDMVAEEGHWYVPKAETPYAYWNRLMGVEGVQRTQ